MVLLTKFSKNATAVYFATHCKSMMLLSSAVLHSGEKLAWAIIILLECLQHVLKMYTWSLFENQASIQFKCRLINPFSHFSR